jgi:hypothetical protein
LTYTITAALTGSWGTPAWWPTAAMAAPARNTEAMVSEQAVQEMAHPCTSLFGSYNFWLFDDDSRGPCGLGVGQ